ncbi:hypothetical protein KRM28CT15_44590 [Krasilnikovia sp. M28-CT-15]
MRGEALAHRAQHEARKAAATAMPDDDHSDVGGTAQQSQRRIARDRLSVNNEPWGDRLNCGACVRYDRFGVIAGCVDDDGVNRGRGMRLVSLLPWQSGPGLVVGVQDDQFGVTAHCLGRGPPDGGLRGGGSVGTDENGRVRIHALSTIVGPLTRDGAPQIRARPSPPSDPGPGTAVQGRRSRSAVTDAGRKSRRLRRLLDEAVRERPGLPTK